MITQMNCDNRNFDNSTIGTDTDADLTILSLKVRFHDTLEMIIGSEYMIKLMWGVNLVATVPRNLFSNPSNYLIKEES